MEAAAYINIPSSSLVVSRISSGRSISRREVVIKRSHSSEFCLSNLLQRSSCPRTPMAAVTPAAVVASLQEAGLASKACSSSSSPVPGMASGIDSLLVWFRGQGGLIHAQSSQNLYFRRRTPRESSALENFECRDCQRAESLKRGQPFQFRSGHLSPTVSCRSSSFDSLDGYFCKEARNAASSSPLNCSCASVSHSPNSGVSGRRGPGWSPRKALRCQNSSRELDEGGEGDNFELPSGDKKEGRGETAASGSTSASTLSNSSKMDQAPTEIGSLESELFLYTGRMRALESFRNEVSKPDEEINLVRTAVFVAQHLYPRITAEEVEAQLDSMAAELEPVLPPLEERYTMRMVNSINNYLYGELGYKGADKYMNLGNSCINMVLERRQGLPLTMSLVYMELAKRVGLPMQGVNLPAHFMCRPIGEGLEFFIDAHAGGKVTFLQDAEDRLSVVYGVPVIISPDFLKHTDITNRGFLIRLLFNLKRIYMEMKDPVSTLCIIDYLKLIRPGVIEEIRDYGICLYLLKRFSEAIPCLESYVQGAPKATDVESIRSLVIKMRRDL